MMQVSLSAGPQQMLGAHQIIERKIIIDYVNAKARAVGRKILIRAHADEARTEPYSVINLH
jgi:hypothetical protein